MLFAPPPRRPRRADFEGTGTDPALARMDYLAALELWADLQLPAWIEMCKSVLTQNGVQPVGLEDGHGSAEDPSRQSFPGPLPPIKT